MKLRSNMQILPIAAAACWLAAIGFCGCSDDQHSYVPNIIDGENTPTMSTLNVNTFISDSGYTRYFITSAIWNMYEDAQLPFWRFPEELHLEQYDRDMAITATMRCDSALYWSTKRLWRLDGDVVVVNTAGDSFLTQQVYWDQLKSEVRSDSFIHIVKADRIIEGYGFTSNESMTAYTVNKPTGIFPVNKSDVKKEAEAEAEDSVAERPEVRQPARRQPSRALQPNIIEPTTKETDTIADL